MLLLQLHFLRMWHLLTNAIWFMAAAWDVTNTRSYRPVTCHASTQVADLGKTRRCCRSASLNAVLSREDVPSLPCFEEAVLLGEDCGQAVAEVLPVALAWLPVLQP